MWMPAQTTVPPLASARSAAGTSAPTGAKMIAASSGSGGAAPDVAGPLGAELAREALRRVVAGAREREHAPALVAGDLADDVRGGAEAVEAEPLGVAGHPQRAVADQPGAQQRRGLEVRVAVGDREAEARVGDRVLGEAAVEVAAGEARAVAQVLAAGAAVAARAAGPAQPRHADALARPGARCRRSGARARRGGGCRRSSPSTTCRSVRQTPQACTRISTLAVGRARAPAARPRRSGGPGASSTIARMAFRASDPAISAASSATSVGVWPTRTPRASSASCLAFGRARVPETIAPAWPIVLPGGAVKPAM